MEKKISAFLQKSGVNPNLKLIDKISIFLKDNSNKLLFKNGQIYFLTDDKIIDCELVESNSIEIIEFDGHKLVVIGSEYYLGNQNKLGNGGGVYGFDQNNDFSNNNNNNNNNNGGCG